MGPTVLKASYTVNLEIEIAKLGEVVAIRREGVSAFIEASQWNKLVKAHDNSVRGIIEDVVNLDWFSFLKNNVVDKFLKSDGFRTMGSVESITSALDQSLKSNDSIRMIQHKSFDPSKLFFFQSYDHTLWTIGSKYPVSIPYRMDYIDGGVDNGRFDLELAMKILKSNTWVRNIELINIPYYNSDRGKDKAIEFTVLLPQYIHDKLCKKQIACGDNSSSYRGNGRCSIRDMISSVYSSNDLLGLKRAMKETIES